MLVKLVGGGGGVGIFAAIAHHCTSEGGVKSKTRRPTHNGPSLHLMAGLNQEHLQGLVAALDRSSGIPGIFRGGGGSKKDDLPNRQQLAKT